MAFNPNTHQCKNLHINALMLMSKISPLLSVFIPKSQLSPKCILEYSYFCYAGRYALPSTSAFAKRTRIILYRLPGIIPEIKICFQLPGSTLRVAVD